MQNVHVHVDLEMPKDGYSLLDLALLYTVLEITSSNYNVAIFCTFCLFVWTILHLTGQNV